MPDPSLIFTRPIRKGPRLGGDSGNCSVELLGLAIYGHHEYGWHLPCIDTDCQAAVVSAQDRLDDETRNSRRWRLIIARLATCHRTDNARVARRMALWAARSVEHLSDNPLIKACNDTLERWLAGEVTDEELLAMSKKVEVIVVDDVAAVARQAASSQMDAVTTTRAGYWAARAVAGEDPVDWVDRYLDAWAKIAADEGCMALADQEAEYLEFVEKLDFLTISTP